MVEVPRGEWKGSVLRWSPVYDTERDCKSARVWCPRGHTAWLDHDIAADGTVSPSVVCPDDHCTWHEHIRLLGWEP